MKSSPLDDWPLDGQVVSPEQHAQLAGDPEMQQELANWNAIEAQLAGAPMVGPAPGFADRWRRRLESRQERRQQRQVQLFFGMFLAGAFTALTLVGLQALASPAGLIAAWLEAAIRAGQLIQAGIRLLALLGDGIPAIVIGLGLSAALAWVSMFWIAAIYRYGYGSVPNGVTR